MKNAWQRLLPMLHVKGAALPILFGIGSALLSASVESGGLAGKILALGAFFPLLMTVLMSEEEGLLIASASALGVVFLRYTSLDVIGYAFFYVIPVWVCHKVLFSSHNVVKKTKPNIQEVLNVDGKKLLNFIIHASCIGTIFFFVILLSLFEKIDPSAFLPLLGNPAETENVREKILFFLSYLPFCWGVMWGGIFLINIFLSFAVAKFLKVKHIVVHNTFSSWRVSTWQYWALVLVGTSSLSGQFFPSLAQGAQNLLFFTLFPFCVEGVIIVNSLLVQVTGNRRKAIFLLGGLVFLGWPLIVLTLMGIFEPWGNLHERLRLYQKGKK